MTFHHYSLWDHRKGALVALIAALIVTYVPAVVLAANTVIGYRSEYAALAL